MNKTTGWVVGIIAVVIIVLLIIWAAGGFDTEAEAPAADAPAAEGTTEGTQ